MTRPERSIAELVVHPTPGDVYAEEARPPFSTRIGARAARTPSLVLPSAPVFVRNNDVDHDYRQDSDLHPA